jgi:uncharacterized membrane protein
MVLRTRRENTGNRLSVPRGAALRTGPVYDPDAFGRFSEGIARYLGTGKFLAGQTVLVAIWIAFNTLGIIHHWDPYPFILLNLAFSTQAAYAAPLILLAQNRQDERDRLSIERDREVAARTQADTEFLARELTAVRLSVADTVTNEDLDHALEHLVEAMARIEARLDGVTAGKGRGGKRKVREIGPGTEITDKPDPDHDDQDRDAQDHGDQDHDAQDHGAQRGDEGEAPVPPESVIG